MDSISSLLIVNANIPINTIIFLVTLPILATTIGIIRYIIGLRTFNLFPNLILVFIFFQLSINEKGLIEPMNGIKYGLFILVFTLVCTTIVRSLVNRINMHFVPKKTLIISFICICILISLVFASALYRTGYANIDILVLLLIIIICEEYLSLYTKKGAKTTIKMTAETIAISLVMFLIISWQNFQIFLLTNLWIVPIVILVNFFVGKYMGLRVLEYFRFKNLLLSDDEPDESSPKQK